MGRWSQTGRDAGRGADRDADRTDEDDGATGRWGRDGVGRSQDDHGGSDGRWTGGRDDNSERYRDQDSRYTAGQGGDLQRDNRGWRDDRYLGEGRERRLSTLLDPRHERYDRERGEYGGGQSQPAGGRDGWGGDDRGGGQGSWGSQGPMGGGDSPPGGPGGSGRWGGGEGGSWNSSQGVGGGGRPNPWSGGQGLLGGGQNQWAGQGPGHRTGEHTGRGPKNYSRRDERIVEDVNDALTRDGHVDATHIDVTCVSGEVTLSGTVADRRQKRAAEDAIEHVHGVREVHNTLRVARPGGETAGTPADPTDRIGAREPESTGPLPAGGADGTAPRKA